MINVLVFPCSSGIGQEIYNALKYHKDITLYGTNSSNVNTGSILYGSSYIENAPPMSKTEDCINWLNNIIKAYNIDCIFPAYDDANVWLKTNEIFLSNIKIITSSIETVLICRSKKVTYDKFKCIIRCPKVYSSIESVSSEYPIFIKPECGEGSKGCHVIYSEDSLKNTITNDHIIIEYLPGVEYTVDCFSDIFGNLLFVGPRVRSATRSGISVITETFIDVDNEFCDIAHKINCNLKCIGAWFFQVKRSIDNELCLMEIAPRVSGAMFLYRQQGINFPLLSVYTHMGLSINIIPPKLDYVVGCKIYTNNFYIPQFIKDPIVAFYIDLDDTLTLSGQNKANPNVISLLYESKLANIPIYLITRHKGVVEETLDILYINKNIFNKIIHITDKTEKTDYIINRPAILLDDSYSERYKCDNNIYVFDIDSLEIVRDIIKMSYSRFLITHE